MAEIKEIKQISVNGTVYSVGGVMNHLSLKLTMEAHI